MSSTSEIVNSAYYRFIEQCHFPKDQPVLNITFNCTDEEAHALFRIQDELTEKNVSVSVTRINKTSWHIYMTQTINDGTWTEEQEKYSKRATRILEILLKARDNPTNSNPKELGLIEFEKVNELLVKDGFDPITNEIDDVRNGMIFWGF